MKFVLRIARIVRPALLTACVAAGMGALPALAQTAPAGIPVPEDSAIFTAFKQLEQQPAYRMTMVAEPSDPRIAQMAAAGMGFSPAESIVKGGVHQVTMHMKMPAMDKPGVIDDWEIRAVVQNGRGARLITSPSLPRILKYSEQVLQMEMAMLDRQAATAMVQAAAQGPFGAIAAANIAAQTAIGNIMAARTMKKEKEFFSWQCMPQMGGGQKAESKTNQMTDMRLIGDESVGGASATAYEFYVRDGDRFQGPMRLLVAKDTGLPLRIEMTDPQGRGSMHMDYSFDKITDIEIPPCMSGGQ
jgi:hypothetical protein